MTPKERAHALVKSVLISEGNDRSTLHLMETVALAAIRETREEDAKIAENYEGHSVNWYNAVMDVASAIRARASEDGK